MKKESKYLLLLGLAVVIYLGLKLFSPKEHNWHVTFNRDDENPFGGYVMNALLTDLFPGHEIIHSYKTFYETYDSTQPPINLLVIAQSFIVDEEDLNCMLKNVEAGGNIFISAEDFNSVFSDTLGFRTYDYFWISGSDYNYFNSKQDTTELFFNNPVLQNGKEFYYPRYNIHKYFDEFDPATTTVISTNDLNYPVTIKVKCGKGNFFLNSTPLAFSNAYLLPGDNPEYISRSLSYLPPQDLIWSEYYQMGRMEIQTPLRFILTTEPLKWAYYLMVFSLIVFMIFEAKRKQRIIPVVKPLLNTSLEFVSTIANLYFQNGDHKDIAEKKIGYFLEFVRAKYWLDTTKITPEFISTLTRRSGNSKDDVKRLFVLFDHVKKNEKISADELIMVNKEIEKFHKNSL